MRIWFLPIPDLSITNGFTPQITRDIQVMVPTSIPSNFHSATRHWFAAALGVPTPVQLEAWAALGQGASHPGHALISAPTGEGKTLAAFLAIIDKLVQRAVAGENIRASRILYISPLKALSNDIEKNLQIPLRGIQEELRSQGIEIDEIHAMVRTGDSTASERARLVRLKPQIVVTTPESLYLLLTSASGREMLSTIETVIVDEIHALVSNRRGAHLALSLERLEQLRLDKARAEGADLSRFGRMQRIGISATVRPLEKVAQYLAGDAPVACCVDQKKRPFDIRLLIPEGGLSAVMDGDSWAEIYQKLAAEIQERRTTLIFVNNRRLCERLARHLSELLGQNLVASHHGSLSHAARHRSEQMLKAGELKVMVATSSLELGLDIGSIDLVVQISSPRSIHAFIQRVGRSEHHKYGTSRALLIPLSRDDLSECIALIRALRQGELEEVRLCAPAVDVLAQQVVAEVSMRDYAVDELFEMFKGSFIYRDLGRESFLQVLQMLNDGYSLRFGRKARHIFFDKVSAMLHTRPGTRIYAALNGGAIPENFEYEVVEEGAWGKDAPRSGEAGGRKPDGRDGVFVGTVHEDFAIESIQGDVFQLGNRMWQITRVSGNRVSVFAAPDKHPTIPFWIVDVPGRSDALSRAVSELNRKFNSVAGTSVFVQETAAETGLPAQQISILAEYLDAAREHLKVLPTQDTVILERFFDEVNNCHIVLHSPFGTQVNRAWGLALRKRFCRQFNFELQAAANDNAIILSLSHTHSFQLDEVFSYLNSRSARDVLTQALLDAPMFEIRWRWNASRALAILRRTAKGKTPAQWQKSNAQDLIALLFPDQIACAENLAGPRSIPDHPLVTQTLFDCLNEAMDADGFLGVLSRLESGAIRTVTLDSSQPSPLAHEIINARPYAFLDDAPLEERRTRAVRTNLEERTGDEISDATIAAVKAESLYPARNAYELYDRITQFAILPESEIGALGFSSGLTDLRESGKIIHLDAGREFTYSADKADIVRAAYNALPAEQDELAAVRRSQAIEQIVLSHLELLGPMTAAAIGARLALPESSVQFSLAALENAGSVFRLARNGEQLYIERAFYQRLLHFNRRPKDGMRRITPNEYLGFLQRWHRASDDKPEGSESLRKVLRQLQGVSLSQDAWQAALRHRLRDFSSRMLEEILLTGEFFWWRPALPGTRVRNITPKTRYMILSRELWYRIAPVASEDLLAGLSADARRVYVFLESHGASFTADIHHAAKVFSEQTLRGLRELIARGLITSDQFFALPRLSGSRASVAAIAGRFARVIFPHEIDEDDRRTAIAGMLLARHGVVYRYAAEADFFKEPWPKLVKTLRIMEMQGLVRGGRYIEGLWGEQFAEPAAIPLLTESGKILYKEDFALDPIALVRRQLARLGVLAPAKTAAAPSLPA